MGKFEDLLEKNNLKTFEVANSNGNNSRLSSLNRVVDGKTEISNLSFNIIIGAANALGVPLEDIMEPWDLDGRSGQIQYITRLMGLIADNNAEYSNVYPDGGYVKGINLYKQEKRNEGDFINIKKDYEILDPTKTHDEQELTPTYELNREFLNRNERRRETRNKTIQNFHSSFNTNALSFLIYTPLALGGDFKLAITVFDKEDLFMFSEVYGVEWIDQEDQREIVYYKSRINDIVNPENIKNSDKEVISELEFFKGLKTQFPKYNIRK